MKMKYLTGELRDFAQIVHLSISHHNLILNYFLVKTVFRLNWAAAAELDLFLD
jgi:hypothetical protein